MTRTPASFVADGAYDRSAAHEALIASNPIAGFIVLPCKGPCEGQLLRQLQLSEIMMFSPSTHSGWRDPPHSMRNLMRMAAMAMAPFRV